MDYIKEASTPFIDSLIRKGTRSSCLSMVPTVTNVNNASIITGGFPDEHGITSNWYYDQKTGIEVFMDSSEFLTCLTYLERAANRSQRTLLITVKDKLRRLLDKGSTASFSLERPTKNIIEEIGSPPDIYEFEASPWLINAALNEVSKKEWDIVYVSTTDYIPHKFKPKDTIAKEYMNRIDEGLEAIFSQGYEIGIVADHGMNAKKVNIDPVMLLEEYGINGKIVATIKDEHMIHHMNLGGSAYLYVNKVDEASEILLDAEGIEAVLRRGEAAKQFRLNSERIGDLLLLAEMDYTFGINKGSNYRDIAIRSHGSLHEREVPFIITKYMESRNELFNKDLIQSLIAH
jgi:phosphonoacetate hydrolase